jgi:hypothetical protein
MKAVSFTSEKAWAVERFNLGHLRVFGCRTFVHIPGEKCTNWMERAGNVSAWDICKQL